MGVEISREATHANKIKKCDVQMCTVYSVMRNIVRAACLSHSKPADWM